ncbi:MAG: hypothetical protein HXX08_06525 [Chloroflexi bacterium]|uniref:Uncharacterized protein n=1 Tax=Candidatus Chlorohelix allophototropha TaxID=3003348 RepID=A0A8T7M385_9CHLR|nr:hypothetical protein [Chloroflexota bacterium]WJW67387.1 hypothetical protein OZ401_000653 [Chloroflexota bacterium L227-S17]
MCHKKPESGVSVEATRVKGLIMFGDEASFAQWGLLGYPFSVLEKLPV